MSKFEKVKCTTRVAMDTPPDVIFSDNGVTAYSSLIPWDDRYCSKIFFVTDSTGGEYGQFESAEKAMTQALHISKMAPQERASHEV